MKRIYLDNAAATPLDSKVLTAMMPFLTDEYYNPSALYEGARRVKLELESARAAVARQIGAKPAEIVFTAGGTESDNLAIHGVMGTWPDAGVLISAIEHDAVFEPAQNYQHSIVPVEPSGRINIDSLEKSVSDETVLISVMLVNSEIGTIEPIQEIAKIVSNIRTKRRARSINTPLYLHTDACQAPLYLDIDINRLGVDLLTLNGGKIHGPKQSGVLYVRAGLVLKPTIQGGGQEHKMRSGTENVAFAVGFARALELAEKGRKQRVKDVSALRDYFISELESRFSAECSGSKKNRISNNVHVIFPEHDNERILFALDDMGVDAATGSACSASKDEPSRVLKAIGKTDSEAKASIRFSLGKETTNEEVDRVLELLKKALKA